MTLRITDTCITSDKVPAAAEFRQHAGGDGNGAWVTSLRPGRLLSRDEAVTAMTIADVAASVDTNDLAELVDVIKLRIGGWHEFPYESPRAVWQGAIESIDRLTRRLGEVRGQLESELRQDEEIRTACWCGHLERVHNTVGHSGGRGFCTECPPGRCSRYETARTAGAS